MLIYVTASKIYLSMLHYLVIFDLLYIVASRLSLQLQRFLHKDFLHF